MASVKTTFSICYNSMSFFVGSTKKTVHWSDSAYDNDDYLVDTPFLYGTYVTLYKCKRVSLLDFKLMQIQQNHLMCYI